MISWVAVEGMLEREAAENAEYHARIAGRPRRSLARLIDDGELLAALRTYRIAPDRAKLRALCETALSAQEITEPFIDRIRFAPDEDPFHGDRIWIYIETLWRRWYPEIPSFEMLDDKMEAGYALLKNKETAAAARVWLEAWDDVVFLLKKADIRTISAFDERFQGSYSLCGWIQDLEMELGNAGRRDRKFLAARAAMCEQALHLLEEEDSDNTENLRIAMAESYFETGDFARAETLYRAWLDNDPHWGWGWIGWADLYFFTFTTARDLRRAEALLEQGLAVPGVRDADEITERLACIRREQQSAQREHELVRPPKTPVSIVDPLSAAVRGEDKPVGAGAWSPGHGIRLVDQVDEAELRTPAPQSGARVKASIGRNDPCSCGSGRKYKKGCG
ncbi:MAG: tetratricopeptide repeat protein [Blastocatellia bacterium]